MGDSDCQDKDKDFPLPDMDRREFLRLGLIALPFLSASLVLPRSVWAQTKAVAPVSSGALCEPKEAAAVPAPASKPRPPRLLMLDPGHGGHDPGAIGVSGAQEKDVVLDIASRMADIVSGERGLTARLTREKDVFLSLGERVEIGRQARADMFISVHADSAPNPSARGLSVYSLSKRASDQFASQLADQENRADKKGGLNLPTEDQDVAEILFDLTARHTTNTAQRVKVGFIKAMERRWTLLEQPMRSANFAVLRSPDVPSLLIETGFLSNKNDEALLTKPAQRQKIAALMAKELAFLLKSPLFG